MKPLRRDVFSPVSHTRSLKTTFFFFFFKYCHFIAVLSSSFSRTRSWLTFTTTGNKDPVYTSTCDLHLNILSGKGNARCAHRKHDQISQTTCVGERKRPIFPFVHNKHHKLIIMTFTKSTCILSGGGTVCI